MSRSSELVQAQAVEMVQAEARASSRTASARTQSRAASARTQSRAASTRTQSERTPSMRTSDAPVQAMERIDETSEQEIEKIDRLVDFAIGAIDIKK